MISPNPYAPPSAAPIEEPSALRDMVVAWEKLRLLYNGLMILPGLGILILWVTRQQLPLLTAIIGGILVGIGANFAFMLGPLAELYLRGLLRNGSSLGKGRLLIFGAGLVVSGGVFVMFGIISLL